MDPKQLILLLEDEPISAEFLCTALAPLAADVRLVGSLRSARELLRQHRFSLLLLDLSLPDGSGDELLRELRASPDSPSQISPALALTAEIDGARRAALRTMGFADALAKPIAAAALRDVVVRCLANTSVPHGAEDASPSQCIAVWDDAAALAACGGNPEVLGSLRGLFLKELPDQSEKIRRGLQAERSHEALDELHRLLAGCGFCGASSLARSARDLMHRVREEADVTLAMVEFELAVQGVLSATRDD